MNNLLEDRVFLYDIPNNILLHKIPTRYTIHRVYFYLTLLCMFRALLPPTVRSTKQL